MGPVQITFLSIGGVTLFLIICITVLCIRCGRWCWRPNLKGINWTSRDLGTILKFRIETENNRWKYQMHGVLNREEAERQKRERERAMNLKHYEQKKAMMQMYEKRIMEYDEWEVSSSNLQIFDEKLGSGAYAVVHKGHLKGIPPVAKMYPSMQLSYVLSNEANYVAVKTVHEYAAEEERKEFIEEIKFMKQLEYHPHILSLIGCSTALSYPLILTEICELGDLLTLVRFLGADYKNMKSVLEFNDLVPIAWQISDALTFLSGKSIIHRDVAARNVLITKNKMAKLSDFGLCRFNKELFYHSRGGKLPIKWMAPESIEFAQFSTKSDIWSFGVLLYEMYSFGKTPFHSIDQREVLPYLKRGERLEIPEAAPSLISSIIGDCWKEEPNDRPEFSKIRQSLYKEMEDNSECYGYLHFSKNYYRAEPTRETEAKIETV